MEAVELLDQGDQLAHVVAGAAVLRDTTIVHSVSPGQHKMDAAAKALRVVGGVRHPRTRPHDERQHQHQGRASRGETDEAGAWRRRARCAAARAPSARAMHGAGCRSRSRAPNERVAVRLTVGVPLGMRGRSRVSSDSHWPHRSPALSAAATQCLLPRRRPGRHHTTGRCRRPRRPVRPTRATRRPESPSGWSATGRLIACAVPPRPYRRSARHPR